MSAALAGQARFFSYLFIRYAAYFGRRRLILRHLMWLLNQAA
jgi:hypothetical protein